MATEPPASASPVTLPQPDPLVNLIDFGNLNRVLTYILDNLSSHNSRLASLENRVSQLDVSTAELGDNVATLRNMVLNIKTVGADETDLDALRERIDTVDARVDSQTREIASLASHSKQHGQAIDILEHSTAALQSVMATKADASELATKASKAIVDRHSHELDALSQLVKTDHEPRIRALEVGMKRVNAMLEAMQNDEFKENCLKRLAALEDATATLRERADGMDARADSIDSAVAARAELSYVDSEIAALLARLKDLEQALAAGMKGELKRFERDVMIYVADQMSNAQAAAMTGGGAAGGGFGAGGGGAGGGGAGSSGGMAGGAGGIGGGGGGVVGGMGGGNQTAAGRFHYRCLTCDAPKDNVPGPSTFRYSRAMGNQPAAHAPGDSRLLEMQLGDQIYLHGTDGGIYKGRTDPVIITAALTSGDNGNSANLRLQSPSSQSLTVRQPSPDRNSGALISARRAASSRPHSADPTRARQNIDPNSGRKSGMDMHLPMESSNAAASTASWMNDAKEQSDAAASGGGGHVTARTLQFPSPAKQSARRASGSTTARSSASLLRANSRDDVNSAAGSRRRPASAHPSSTQQSSSRPPSASSTASAPGGHGHVIMGRPQQESKSVSRTKSGVEIIHDERPD